VSCGNPPLIELTNQKKPRGHNPCTCMWTNKVVPRHHLPSLPQSRNPSFTFHHGSHHGSRRQPYTLRLPPPSSMPETRRRKQTSAATSRSFIPATTSTRASTVPATASHLNHLLTRNHHEQNLHVYAIHEHNCSSHGSNFTTFQDLAAASLCKHEQQPE